MKNPNGTSFQKERRRKNMTNKLVHFEIPANQPEKLKAFYERIFDWTIEKMPGDTMDYWIIKAEGVGGGIRPKSSPEMTPLNYILVENIERHCRTIKRAGGTVLITRTPVPGMGFFALALDPEGNPFGIWEEIHKE